MMVISLKKKFHNRRHNIDKKPLVVFKILNDKCPRIWRHFDVGQDMWNPSFMHTILNEYSPAFRKVTHVWPCLNLTSGQVPNTDPLVGQSSTSDETADLSPRPTKTPVH